jgi:hypothetical protein
MKCWAQQIQAEAVADLSGVEAISAIWEAAKYGCKKTLLAYLRSDRPLTMWRSLTFVLVWLLRIVGQSLVNKAWLIDGFHEPCSHNAWFKKARSMGQSTKSWPQLGRTGA